jgi:hypothetical protein
VSKAPPHQGGNLPFWSRGQWWQQQSDGAFYRWSSFNDEWVATEGAQPESPEEVSARKGRARKEFLMTRLPIILGLQAAALVWVGIVRSAAGSFGFTVTVLLLIETVVFGMIVNWLMKKP